MSLFSQVNIEQEAKRLENLLQKGIQTKNKEVIKFLKKEIYPIYLVDIEETFGAYEENSEIRQVYRE